MSIDTELETLIPFAEATSAFPGRNKLAVQTLHRWRLHGVRGVKLESCIVGGFRFTSTEAIKRFVEAQNVGDSPASAAAPKQRAARSAAARRELQKHGL